MIVRRSKVSTILEFQKNEKSGKKMLSLFAERTCGRFNEKGQESPNLPRVRSEFVSSFVLSCLSFLYNVLVEFGVVENLVDMVY